MEGSFSWRHALALLVTLTSAWLIWTGTRLVLTEPDKTAHMPLMHVSLVTPPAPPAPPKVAPKPPKPVVTKQVASRTPVETSPLGRGPQTTDAPVTNQPASPSPPAPPAPAAPAENLSLENTYISTVHAAIEEQKRYPMSKDARLQQPSGTVTVWFVLNRSGALVESGIEQSAGSILDPAALASVKRASFPPFPTDAWTNESQHRFKVEIYLHPQ
jgi:protein TonB